MNDTAQSVVVVNYTDFIFAEGWDCPSECPDMLLSHLMMRFESKSFGKCGEPLHLIKSYLWVK